MPFTRVQRRLTAWLAMLAIALATLAPTLVQAAVSATDRGQWVQVCSVSGMVWIQADLAGFDGSLSAPEGSPAPDMGMQCPWCQLHSPAGGPPPASAPLLASAAHAAPLGHATAAPPPPSVWPAAPARAPPQPA
jgi:hypothetical protein